MIVSRMQLENVVLEDNNVTGGGISHVGEKADEFCDEVFTNDINWRSYDAVDLNTLNNALNDCGIKTINASDVLF